MTGGGDEGGGCMLQVRSIARTTKRGAERAGCGGERGLGLGLGLGLGGREREEGSVESKKGGGEFSSSVER